MTAKEMIFEYLEKNGRSSPAQIAKYYNTKRLTINARCYTLMQDGILDRVSGVGERGGYGYDFKMPQHIRDWKKKLKELK
jgi:predicted transcriptional regulator